MIPRKKEIQSRVDRRVEPAILILNKEGSTVYQNQSAFHLLGLIPQQKFSERPSKRSSFSRMLFELYTEFKLQINKNGNGEEPSAPLMNRILHYKGARYLLRSIPLKGSNCSYPTHLMVLLELLLRQDNEKLLLPIHPVLVPTVSADEDSKTKSLNAGADER